MGFSCGIHTPPGLLNRSTWHTADLPVQSPCHGAHTGASPKAVWPGRCTAALRVLGEPHFLGVPGPLRPEPWPCAPAGSAPSSLLPVPSLLAVAVFSLQVHRTSGMCTDGGGLHGERPLRRWRLASPRGHSIQVTQKAGWLETHGEPMVQSSLKAGKKLMAQLKSGGIPQAHGRLSLFS